MIRDGGRNHKGPAIRDLERRFPRLSLERLPGCAPDLIPVGTIGSYRKHGRMADLGPRHVKHLDLVDRGHLAEVADWDAPIRSLGAGPKLAFRDKSPAARRSSGRSVRPSLKARRR